MSWLPLTRALWVTSRPERWGLSTRDSAVPRPRARTALWVMAAGLPTLNCRDWKRGSRPRPPVRLAGAFLCAAPASLSIVWRDIAQRGQRLRSRKPHPAALSQQVFLALGELLLSCNWAVVADILLVGGGVGVGAGPGAF